MNGGRVASIAVDVGDTMGIHTAQVGRHERSRADRSGLGRCAVGQLRDIQLQQPLAIVDQPACLVLGQADRLGLTAHRAHERLSSQGMHDGPIPLPHAGEVVDGQAVAQSPVEIQLVAPFGRLEVAPQRGAEVPRPPAPLEPGPVGRAEVDRLCAEDPEFAERLAQAS